jgi:gamma-glutamyltranspeptidase / glutathione hydrolase
MPTQPIAKGIIDHNRSAVASPYPDAVEAGQRVLAGGGNAIDAAVAAMASVCVAVPSAVGLAGYGGSLVAYLADHNRIVSIDFDSRAPLAYRDDLYMGHPENQKTGYMTVTVPGVLAGLALALHEFGTITFADASAHSIELAERGIVVDTELRRHLTRLEQFVDPRSLRALFPDGKTPQVGDRWIQKDLANLLRRLAKESPRAMYEGDLANQILRQLRAHGSVLTEEDFHSYHPSIVDPIHINYRGHEVFTAPPPSGGLTCLQILKVLERFDIAKMFPASADYFHHFAEASKLCWLDRAHGLGDPDFVHIPITDLLSEKSADEKAAKIRTRHITTGGATILPGGPHTANISAADSRGNIVSITATQGNLFGSGVVIDGLGLIMGHGMSRFDFVPGHPNAPRPGKRMHHNMSPMIITKNARPLAALGLPGGTKIVSVTTQLVIDLIDFKMTPEQAVKAPRVHTETDEPVAVSGNTLANAVDALTAMGHTIRTGQDVGGPPNQIGGQANVIAINPDQTASAASGIGASSPPPH